MTTTLALLALTAALVSLAQTRRAARPSGLRVSLLDRLRPRTSRVSVQLDGEHPTVCRCKGTGRLMGGDDCPMIWRSYPAPPPRWLVGRVPRGHQR